MGYGAVQEGVVEGESKLASILRRKPVGYETVMQGVDQVRAEIKWHQRQIEKHTVARNDLENFLAPYLCYEELLNNTSTQTIIGEKMMSCNGCQYEHCHEIWYIQNQTCGDCELNGDTEECPLYGDNSDFDPCEDCDTLSQTIKKEEKQ